MFHSVGSLPMPNGPGCIHFSGLLPSSRHKSLLNSLQDKYSSIAEQGPDSTCICQNHMGRTPVRPHPARISVHPCHNNSFCKPARYNLMLRDEWHQKTPFHPSSSYLCSYHGRQKSDNPCRPSLHSFLSGCQLWAKPIP